MLEREKKREKYGLGQKEKRWGGLMHRQRPTYTRHYLMTGKRKESCDSFLDWWWWLVCCYAVVCLVLTWANEMLTPACIIVRQEDNLAAVVEGESEHDSNQISILNLGKWNRMGDLIYSWSG